MLLRAAATVPGWCSRPSARPGRRAGRADHDRGRADGGVLGDQPPGAAVIGRVQQHLALGRHVMRGQLVQVTADQARRRPGSASTPMSPAVTPPGRARRARPALGQASRAAASITSPATGESSTAATITPGWVGLRARAVPPPGSRGGRARGWPGQPLLAVAEPPPARPGPARRRPAGCARWPGSRSPPRRRPRR